MSVTNTTAPGVYVKDERPLLRPYESASISDLAMISQITLQESKDNNSENAEPITLTSFDDFVRLLKADSLLIRFLQKREIKWTNDGPTVSVEVISKVTEKIDSVLKRISSNEKDEKAMLEASPGSVAEFSPLPLLVAPPRQAKNVNRDLKANAEYYKSTKDLVTKEFDPEEHKRDEDKKKEIRKRLDEVKDKLSNLKTNLVTCTGGVAKSGAAGDTTKLQATVDEAIAAVTTADTNIQDAEKAWNNAQGQQKKVAKTALTKAQGELTARRAELEAAEAALQKAKKPTVAGGANSNDIEKQLGQIAVTAWSVWGYFQNGGQRLHLYDVHHGRVSEFVKTKMGTLSRWDIDAGQVCVPGNTDQSIQANIMAYCGRRDFAHADGESFCFGVLDGNKSEAATPASVQVAKQGEAFDSHSAAAFWPWIVIDEKDEESGEPLRIELPPSAFVAGIIAATDGSVGPHQSPAGEDKVIRGATDLTYHVNDPEAGTLNSIGINCLRQFPGRYPVVFGARTLSSNSLYRYIAVARLLLMIRKTIKAQTRWAVFKPNTNDLRKAIYRNLYTFMEGLRRKGMLEGRSPEEAFMIVCDETNNPPSSRNLGLLNVRVEVAPVRPAEFIVVEVTQKILEG